MCSRNYHTKLTQFCAPIVILPFAPVPVAVGKLYYVLVHWGSFVQWLPLPPWTFGTFLRFIFKRIMKFCYLVEVLSKNSSYVRTVCPLSHESAGFSLNSLLLSNFDCKLYPMLPKLVCNKSFACFKKCPFLATRLFWTF